MRILLYITLGILVYAVLFYLQTYRPETMAEFLVKVDVFGFTDIARQEQERLGKIRDLTIPYEEKQVLINRTVFIGATYDMVKLALGQPKKILQRAAEGSSVALIYYVYYLPGDKRPTILVFQQDKLTNAYKGSVLDIGN